MMEADALFYCYSDKCKGDVQEFSEAWKVEGTKKPQERTYARKYVCCNCFSAYRPAPVEVGEGMIAAGQMNG